MFNDMNNYSKIVLGQTVKFLIPNKKFCFKDYVLIHGKSNFKGVQHIAGISIDIFSCYKIDDVECNFVYNVYGQIVDLILLVKNTDAGKRYYLGNHPQSVSDYQAIINTLTNNDFQSSIFFTQPQ